MSDFRKHFFITLGGVVIVLAIFFSTFLYFLFGIIVPLSAEFRVVQENIKIAEDRIKDFNGRVAPALARGEHNMTKIEKSFFAYSPDTAKEFIVFLETAAERNNLTYEIGSLPQATSPAISMALSGGFNDTITFLREMENSPIFLAIDGVTLRAVGDKISLSIQMQLPIPPQGL